MRKFPSLLCPTPAGLYCPPGDFYIDPVRPVARAIVTHGHGDHARSGHETVVATPETLAIMAARYGEDFTTRREPLGYGKGLTRDGVTVTLAPAGHVLGSAQVVIRWKGMTIAVSAFGLPVFVHPPDHDEIAKLLQSVRQFPGRTHLVGAYALGKAQRLIRLLREAGCNDTLYMHGALTSMNALYQRHGIDLGPLAPATEAKDRLPGRIVLAPPSAIADKWSRRFADPLPVFASGWMRVRARARQRHVELPLIVSDHADWNELTFTIGEVKPQQLWITHGAEEALLRWSALNGIDARALSLVGYDEEGGEA
jgi:putative mRNA 3-end processing factor